MPAMRNGFKAALAAGGRMQTGLFLSTASPVLAEIYAGAGFDWGLIDGEHGASDQASLAPQLLAARANGMDLAYRVPAAGATVIKRALDAGVNTLLVPMVHDGAMAAEVAAMCRYPPRGIRGMGAAAARAADYGRITDYVATADDQICLMVQAESVAAVDNIDAIAATDGVDAVFIGPSDLSADMGLPGQPAHPRVMEAVDHLVARTRAAGKAAGIFSQGEAHLAHYREIGVALVALTCDAPVLARALADLRERSAALISAETGRN